jgi:MFS family permease
MLAPVADHDRTHDIAPPDTLEETPVLEADVVEPTAEVISEPMRAAAGRTFEALKYRDYRLFMTGALLSNIGTWLQTVAQGWLVTVLTGSALWVGGVMFVSGLPTLFLALPAGVLADRLDRRKLIIAGQVAVMFVAFGLAYLVQTSQVVQGNWTLVGWVMVGAFLTGIVTAVTFPAWQAMVPDLVPRETLLNAISLNSAQFHGARLIGPAIAGALMARLGLASAFWANGVSYLAVIWALWIIRPRQERAPVLEGAHREGTWERLLGGVQYARENKSIALLLLSVSIMTFFGMPYVTLLPLFVKETLGGGSDAYAYLMAANGFGALIGALAVAYLARIAHRPTLIRYGMLAFGVSVLAVSLTRTWLVALPVMFVAGAAFLTMQSAINTALQSATPPRIRGRVMALFVLSFMGVMPLGSLAFGAIGHVIGVPQAIAAGQVVVLAWGAFLWVRRGLLDALEEPA